MNELGDQIRWKEARTYILILKISVLGMFYYRHFHMTLFWVHTRNEWMLFDGGKGNTSVKFVSAVISCNEVNT